ncbi:MAG TPA: hypothetical protein PKK15_07580 [Kouleothrix sp.]|nr:hypothetical protein [Kouleothrix sp.]
MAIGGATSSTYVVQSADIGTTLTVTVTASNAGGATAATSAGSAISSLHSSLTAYWQMEAASGNRADATGRGNTLTDSGGTTSGVGIIGNAAQFSASNLSIANNADVAGGDVDITIAFWLYVPSGGSGFPEIFGVDETLANRNYSAFLNMSTNVLTMQFFRSGPTAVTRTITISRDVWQLVIVWHDSVNDLMGIRLNGGADSTVATGGVLQANGTSPLQIGRATSTGTRIPTGSRIDEFGIWRRVLTSGERTTLYNSGAGKTWPFL